ncbi:MAG: hypothetical protein GY696_26300 [Gammaproteobacteria bacterium]|nr:hypothetical protein [Gammaproteobacteria bacterium]
MTAWRSTTWRRAAWRSAAWRSAAQRRRERPAAGLEGQEKKCGLRGSR